MASPQMVMLDTYRPLTTPVSDYRIESQPQERLATVARRQIMMLDLYPKLSRNN
jgi:hypothetical protein